MMLTRAFDDAHVPGAAPGQDVVLHEMHRRGGGRGRRRPWRSTPGDMCFPTYRQQGLLIARDWPLVDMMCQIYRQRARPAEGPAAAGALFGAGRPVSSPSPAISARSFRRRSAGRWRRPTRRHAASPRRWIGEGATAEGDFHHALTFAVGLSRAGHPQRRQQSVGDLVLSGRSPAARGDLRRARASASAFPRSASTATTFLAVYAASTVGGRARPRQSRPDADRVFHLSRRRPFDRATIPPAIAPATKGGTGRSAIRSNG